MTVRVGSKGQVVIPKAIRDRVGIRPGDEVVVRETNGEIRIRRPRTAAELFGLLGAACGPDDLAAERERERRRDAAR